jgi:hypothetical protein
MIKMQTQTAISLAGMAGALILFMLSVTVNVNTRMTKLTVSVDNAVQVIQEGRDHTRIESARLEEAKRDIAVLDSRMAQYHKQ